MTRRGVLRMGVVVAGVSFAAFAIGIWLAPESAAGFVGVASVGAAGTAMLRSNFGGLFAGMAVLSIMAAWTRSRAWTYAAASMVGAIVAGRALGWISGGIGNDVLEMAIEVGLVIILVAYARSVEAPAIGSERQVDNAW